MSDNIDTERLRHLALELRAKADELLGALPGGHMPKQEPTHMRIKEYAASRGFSYDAILKMCGEGLPNVGDSRRRRIVVKDADIWLANHRTRRPPRTPAEESSRGA